MKKQTTCQLEWKKQIEVPNTFRARNKPLVIEADTQHTIVMVTKDLDQLVALQMPHNNLSIAACAGKVAIVHAQAQDGASMHISDDPLDHAGGQIPFPNRLVSRPCEQDLLPCFGVGVQLQAINGVCMRVGWCSSGLQSR